MHRDLYKMTLLLKFPVNISLEFYSTGPRWQCWLIFIFPRPLCKSEMIRKLAHKYSKRGWKFRKGSQTLSLTRQRFVVSKWSESLKESLLCWILIISMTNSTDSDSFTTDERKVISVCHFILELLSSAVLCTCVRLVYTGIEICHPVYAIIFCDLIASLASSLTNLSSFALSIVSFKFMAIAYGNALICVQFYCCCWFVLSVLR